MTTLILITITSFVSILVGVIIAYKYSIEKLTAERTKVLSLDKALMSADKYIQKLQEALKDHNETMFSLKKEVTTLHKFIADNAPVKLKKEIEKLFPANK